MPGPKSADDAPSFHAKNNSAVGCEETKNCQFTLYICRRGMPVSPRDAELNTDVSYIADQYGTPPVRSSRASQLAVELATEKKRLIDELRELAAENDDLKSTCPVGNID